MNCVFWLGGKHKGLPPSKHKDLIIMAKETKKYIKKNFDSEEWIDISMASLENELGEDAIKALIKSGRVKTPGAIYQSK